jgi:hypothetical protein
MQVTVIQPVADPSEVVCDGCADSGWLPKSCDGTHDVICGRPHLHPAHDFVVPCHCRGFNRNYQARVQAAKRLA